MGIVFGIETSGETLSLALSENDTIIRSLDLNLSHSHASQIWILSEALLTSAGLQSKDVDLLAIGKGPGSYTGIRIGTSFAKGWAFGGNIPLTSVGTLENLHSQATLQYADVELYCALDARRNEIFRAFYSSDGLSDKEAAAALMEEENFLQEKLSGPLVLVGTGGPKLFEFFGSPEAWRLDTKIKANAETCCRLGWKKFTRGQTEEASSFEPDYLKPVYITRKSVG